ncbi:MAG: carboxy-S-adenosyl-L-methionine synthase CmoA [Ruminobacter sp.]|nr:carboxy-S-adenosyl-L-methionine synthase CmoA [Ruminobacter sp.]
MHDNIFAAPRDRIGDFSFDDTVASVFPDMIKRSVPGYSNIVSAIGMFTGKFSKPGTALYDLGCSLGACTIEMKRYAAENCRVIGIDNSEAMVSRAKEIVKGYKGNAEVSIITGDITDFDFEPSSVMVLNFVLQFIEPAKRKALLKKIADALVPGGILILSEKFRFPDEKIQDTLFNLHLDFKRANGYSELEISQKRTSLENVLISDDIPTHISRLKECGFSHADVWYQCFNFGSIIAIK